MLSKRVYRQLSVYALAAGASLVAGDQRADAQIVFTPAEEQIGPNQKLSIDFNHDGLTDLIIKEVPYQSSVFYGNSVKALPHSGGGVKQGYGQGFAQALSRGARIGPHEFFLKNRAILERTESIYYTGSWGGVSDHYLGVRFVIDGKLHYGWARLNVSDFGITVTLTGYAYETHPDTPIQAGQTGIDSSGERSFLPSDASPVSRPGDRVGSLGGLALGAIALDVSRR